MQNEVDWLAKIKHQNIISMLGFSVYRQTRCIVYEMMQNGSLESQLHGKGDVPPFCSIFLTSSDF